MGAPRFFSFGASLALVCAAVSIVQAAPFGGFVRNQGQTDERVTYYRLGERAAVYFTAEAVVIELRDLELRSPSEGKEDPLRLDRSPAESVPARAVYVRFRGANSSSRVDACDQLKTRFNYFLGDDPSHWCRDIPTYEKVVYHDLWPGVDLAFRSESGHLKYELNLRDGGDPNDVGFSYAGADRVTRQPDGSELIETAAAALVHRPASSAGAGSLSIGPGEGAAGPRENRYGRRDNPSALIWGTYLGGSGSDGGYDIALDPSGNPVTTGRTYSANFPTTPGAYDTSINGGGDVFVAKLSSGGDTLLWCSFLGGSLHYEPDTGYAIALDSSGNPIVTGRTYSDDFPATPGAFDTSYSGGSDGFVAKLSTDGNALLWSTFLGGGQSDCPVAIVLDPSGNAFLTGTTYSSDFPATSGAYDTSHNGSGDVFVAKLSSSGASLRWGTFLGGDTFDDGYGLTLDPYGYPFLTGRTYSSNFPTTPGAYDRSFGGGGEDAFVAKLSDRGDALLWSTFLGDNDVDRGYALTVDTAGALVLTGYTESTSFPTTLGAYDRSLGPPGDVFVVKLASTGVSLLWGTFLGGGGYDYGGEDLILDPWDNVVLIGRTCSSDFPTTPGAFDSSINGNCDVFLANLSGSGDALLWSSFLGGNQGRAAASDGAGGVVVTGETNLGFPTTPGAYDASYNGDGDVFVAKLLLNGMVPPGACCLPDGACELLEAGVCLAQGGEPLAPGTPCLQICCPDDIDCDGLIDGWEVQGIPVSRGSGKYVLPGANRFHKDVYVEVDAMTGCEPHPGVLDKVCESFANSPVRNPDGFTGIRLHVVGESCDPCGDEVALPAEEWGSDWGRFDSLKAEHFGTILERDLPDWWLGRREAKASAFRYAVFARSIHQNGSGKTGLARGPNLMVTVYHLPGGPSDDEQAGTFMHELGHTFGLMDGGGDAVCYKPNYFSVMNYLWQMPIRNWVESELSRRALKNFQDTWRLDYSHEKLPTQTDGLLDESNAIEPVGLRAAEPGNVPIGPPAGQVLPRLVSRQGGVDWNRDGDCSDPVVAVDANYLIGLSKNPDPGQVLEGYDDWSSLQYLPDWRRQSPERGEPERDEPEEMSLEQFVRLDSLRFDCDGSGVPDDEEIAQGSLEDTNSDGIPDICEAQFSGVEDPGSGSSSSLDVAPNPAIGLQWFRFSVPRAGRVRLDLYDVSGRRVAVLLDADLASGRHMMSWDGENARGQRLPSGVYFGRLTAGSVDIRKAVLRLR